MVERVPHNFLDTSGRVVASFDWNDLASGTGYSLFYGYDTEDGSYRLSNNETWSTVGSSIATHTGGGTEETFERNFDVAFNLPRNVKGDLIVTVVYTCDDFGGGNDIEFHQHIRVLHVNTSGETVIGASQTTATIESDSGVPVTRITSLLFAVDKRFKKGETLRIEIISAATTGEGSKTFGFFHDGANRDFGLNLDRGSTVTAPSGLYVNVPFKIAL